MNATLTIKNFGPIKEAELDLKRFNVFIGKQGEGKSTIAKLIAIFHNLTFFYTNDKLSLFSFYNIQNYFQEYSYLKFENKYYCIECVDKKFQVIAKGDFKLLENVITGKLDNSYFENLLNALDEHFGETTGLQPSESIEMLKRIAEFKQQINSLLRPLNSQYIPVERIFISMISNALYGMATNDISLPKFITAFGNEFSKARSEIKELDINSLGITYKFENGLDKIYKENKAINLSESASGIQSLIPMALVMNYLNEQIKARELEYNFIIEEPELNLYPTTQKYLLGFIMEKCAVRQNGFTLTTHSPYILSCLNNLLFAFRVKSKYPNSEEQIQTIIRKEHWINPEEFNAFYVADGTARTIFNRESGLIAENELDDISDDLAGERDQLMEIYKTKK
jgi:predicted ATPase